MRRPAHPAESPGSVAGIGVASSPPAIKTPAPRPSTPPPAPAAESSVPTLVSAPLVSWSPDDEVAILNALRSHRGRHQDDLPRGVDLVMAVLGRLRRTDYSLADLEAKVDALRRRFEENRAALCAGTGGPAPGHDFRLYTLSLGVWATAATHIAASKPAEQVPAPPVKKNHGRVVFSRRWEPAPAPKRRRYEELQERCPKLAALVQELMRKGLEGISDAEAWSLEMRLKNQQVTSAVCADDRVKELTSLITRLV